jgi:succinate-semialdehyde dehydrogenase/glutarate-semialdehyde dehydrogenase
VIRKISFTGSTPVGKLLLGLAAQGVKRATMELGGHAPVVVFDDVDPVQAARQAVTAKFRNAGQVCTSPTRFYVQQGIYAKFVEAFAEAAGALRVGDGLAAGVQMGPLANSRRVEAMEAIVADTLAGGARLVCGGQRPAGPGYFFPPTVFADVQDSARVMNEEPFGPVVPISSFATIEEALQRANRLPYGLAAYAMTRSLNRAAVMSESLEAGMVCINHFTVSTPSSPFGGMKESGYGSEGGVEGLDAYLVTKSVTQRSTGADLEP